MLGVEGLFQSQSSEFAALGEAQTPLLRSECNAATKHPRRDTRTKGTYPMNREPIPGECIVVTRNTDDHGGQVGDRYIVSRVDDDDDTIKGIPRGSSTVANYWIPWCDIEPVEFGWNYARAHLPDDVATLLAACDGVEYLSLNRQIKNAIIESLPDWRERVMEVLESIDPEDR